jgi:hypothetical protein
VIFATGEVRINYAEGPPSGPPFVLLHGGAARWQYGQHLLDRAAANAVSRVRVDATAPQPEHRAGCLSQPFVDFEETRSTSIRN